MWRESKIGKWVSLSIHLVCITFAIYYSVFFLASDSMDYLLHSDYTESTVLTNQFQENIYQIVGEITDNLFFAPEGKINEDLELLRILKNNGDVFSLTISDLRKLKDIDIYSYLQSLDIVYPNVDYYEGICKILYKRDMGDTNNSFTKIGSSDLQDYWVENVEITSYTTAPTDPEFLYFTPLRDVENWIESKISALSYIENERNNQSKTESEMESNFLYYVTFNNQVYTNNIALENMHYRQIPDSYKNYYYVDKNKSDGYKNFYNYAVERLVNNTDQNVKFIAVIDPALTKDDVYKSIANTYGIKHTKAIYSVVLLGVSFIGGLLSFIYLVNACGHKKDVDGIYLSWYDRINSELCLMGSCLAGTLIMFIIMSIGSEITSGYYSKVVEVVVISLIGVVTYFIFLTYLFRLIRRKKAGVRYIDTSILTGIIRFGKRLYQNREKTTRIIIAFSIYLVLNLSNIVLFRYSSMLVVFAVVINGATLYYLIQKAIWFHKILQGVKKISEGDLEYQIKTEGMVGDEKELATSINQLGDGLQSAVSMATKNERMKSELITNVSHDIKTPLTSIINYVDLIKRERVQNEKVNEYIDILDQKSQRLKHLIEDLVEASKANTGNIKLDMKPLNLVEMLKQTLGEFDDKFLERNLYVLANIPDAPAVIQADGRRLWRVFENLFNNAYKYSMPGTRIYVDTIVKKTAAAVVIKNISESPLNITPDELTERFVRGDVSRTTEGSGLGLSIAKSLTELMGGKLIIYLDGDLFRVTLIFDLINEDFTKDIVHEPEKNIITVEDSNIEN